MPEHRLARARATLPAGYQFGQARAVVVPRRPWGIEVCGRDGHGPIVWANAKANHRVLINVCDRCGAHVQYDVANNCWKGAGE